MERLPSGLAVTATLVLLAGACTGMTGEDASQMGVVADPLSLSESPYDFEGPVFDIAVTPDGSILVADGDVIKEISRRGVTEVAVLPTLAGEGPIGVPAVTPINGLHAAGRRSIFATRGGLDRAEGAALWHVSQGGARLVADIEAFENQRDPDALEGPQWKDPQCEAAQGYTAGAQSNPYHLTALSGSEVLIGDAAGNTLLSARINGEVDWVALFTPPVGEDGEWLTWATLEDGTDCYVQPVPTSVAIGPDGAYYVGELTGVTAENIVDGEPSTGLSRVWRIEPGSRNVVCPSDDCAVVIEGLTSVIDVTFGPDDRLYLVEYDQAGWFAALELDDHFGFGTIKSCDVATGACEVVEDELVLPGAIAFDKRGDLWLLDNTFAPVVRRVDVP